jgi:ribosomal protein S12 methylthiotransferase
MRRFYLYRLGCPKNDADAEIIAGFLSSRGMLRVDDPEAADLLIVNTCGFIQPAKEESIAAIFEMARHKTVGDGRKLVVTGCLSQRYANDLKTQMPEVDGIFGIHDFTAIPDVFDPARGSIVSCRAVSTVYPEYDFPRQTYPDEVFAYLKIADGCDNRCSYCAIPDIRGPYRSRAMETIEQEARYLLDQGKRELILVSQEATGYGRDRYGRAMLLPLLERLTSLPGPFWLRVMYLHPARLTRELIDYMVDNPVICSYFDVPLQHCRERILRLMNRAVTTGQIEEVLGYIRSRSREAAIRTGFIVGFPGESEDDFEELCRFVTRHRFERMGAFAYSAEDGTPAAGLIGEVSEEVKQQRLDRLMVLQQEMAFANNESAVGRRLDVLIDAVDREQGLTLARSRFDAPEIDQTVRLEGTEFERGQFAAVVITGTDGYDLTAGKGGA